MAVQFDYPSLSPLRALSVMLLQHPSSVLLDLLNYWIGFPSQPRGFSDIKEWYNMDTSREFFVQRVSTEDMVASKTISEFESLFHV
jgi:hypothetical protein